MRKSRAIIGFGQNLIHWLEWKPTGGFCSSSPRVMSDYCNGRLERTWNHLYDLEIFVGSLIFQFLMIFWNKMYNVRKTKRGEVIIEREEGNEIFYSTMNELFPDFDECQEENSREIEKALNRLKDIFETFKNIGKGLSNLETNQELNKLQEEINKVNALFSMALEKTLKKVFPKKKKKKTFMIKALERELKVFRITNEIQKDLKENSNNPNDLKEETSNEEDSSKAKEDLDEEEDEEDLKYLKDGAYLSNEELSLNKEKMRNFI